MTPEGKKEPILRKYGDVTGTFSETTGSYVPTGFTQSGTVIVWDSSSAVVTYKAPQKVEEEPEKPKQLSGKCKFCGKFQNGLTHHENNVCDKRFRRKR